MTINCDMKISLLENGMDSLKRGFLSYLSFKEATENKTANLEDYLELKHAILSTHHGIEILMKAFRKVRTDGYPYLVLADRLLTEYRG